MKQNKLYKFFIHALAPLIFAAVSYGLAIFLIGMVGCE